jgi:hypothetical protein
MVEMTSHQLFKLGMRNFDDTLYLFPATWFDDIPDGMLVTTVNGDQIKFSKKTSSRDQRYGWLGFGVKAVK